MFCDSIKITLSLKVKDDFAGVNGFILYHNTQKIGQYKYGQKEYLIDLQRKNCDSVYRFLVEDFDNVGCKSDTTLTFNQCCNQNCIISDLQIIENCQNNALTDLWINFKYRGVADSFDLTSSNKYYGRYSYRSLPLKIQINNLMSPNIDFIITDSKSSTCKLNQVYIIKCFTPPKCTISELKLRPLACNEKGDYFAEMTFKVKDPLSLEYKLNINGKL